MPIYKLIGPDIPDHLIRRLGYIVAPHNPGAADFIENLLDRITPPYFQRRADWVTSALLEVPRQHRNDDWWSLAEEAVAHGVNMNALFGKKVNYRKETEVRY